MTAASEQITRRDKDPVVGILAHQRPDKILNLRSAHRCLPALRLHIDDIQTQTVLINEAGESLNLTNKPDAVQMIWFH